MFSRTLEKSSQKRKVRKKRKSLQKNKSLQKKVKAYYYKMSKNQCECYNSKNKQCRKSQKDGSKYCVIHEKCKKSVTNMNDLPDDI